MKDTTEIEFLTAEQARNLTTEAKERRVSKTDLMKGALFSIKAAAKAGDSLVTLDYTSLMLSNLHRHLIDFRPIQYDLEKLGYICKPISRGEDWNLSVSWDLT